MPGMSDRPQPPHVLDRRDVLNRHWPRHPRRYKDHVPGYKVTARIVWERDGVEYVEGLATRWDANHVYVRIDNDKRLTATGVWLKPEDVYRAEPEEPDPREETP